MMNLNATNMAAFRETLRNSPMLGEAVCYSVRGVAATRTQVESALDTAGLPIKEARQFCFRNAFRRQDRRPDQLASSYVIPLVI